MKFRASASKVSVLRSSLIGLLFVFSILIFFVLLELLVLYREQVMKRPVLHVWDGLHWVALIGFFVFLLSFLPVLQSNYGWVEIDAVRVKKYIKIFGRKYFEVEISISEISEIHFGSMSQSHPFVRKRMEVWSVYFVQPGTFSQRRLFGGIIFDTREQVEAYLKNLPFRKPTYFLTAKNEKIPFEI